MDRLAERERKSRLVVIMAILEEHFERGKKLGEILVDMGRVVPRDVEEALEHQRSSRNPRLLGEISVKKGLVGSEAVKRALVVQGLFRRRQ